ncbi:hypothetical protein [Serratia sp. UGAL515B_01]|uniref:hypothetical protein n=1 Tax=Serratia sp. UGAL515B_01 TaxID=2986763 RepID=UPI0029533D3D|nr:hypothetical protein [Serratia sp. UGAL515B_01]WON78033.1 hypothetical protein OK023_04990 [Serratia sp. UGAL515B_01]
MKLKKLCGVAMVLATLMTSGCHSYDSVQLNKQQLGESYNYYELQPPLYAGDEIRYQLKDGKKGELKVAKKEPNTIVGENGEVIQISEIASLERKDLSKTKTAAAVGGGVAATTAVIVVLAVSVTAGLVAVFASAI